MASKRFFDSPQLADFGSDDGFSIVIPCVAMSDETEGQDRHTTAGQLRDWIEQNSGKVTKVGFPDIFYGNDGSGNEAFFTVEYARELLGINESGGADGLPGKSAYQVALDNGFVGTVEQWLASLHGQSAYQLAVAGGYVGTQTQWIASLKGAPGTDGADGNDGLSAFEIAVNNGFEGDQTMWLASLVGPPGSAGDDGNDGISAYQSAVNNGFEGTEAQWLESFGGLPSSLTWGVEDLASPPDVWVDADDPTLYTTADFSRAVQTMQSKFNNSTITLTPSNVMLQGKAVPFNGRRAFSMPGTSGAGKIAFGGSAGLALGKNASYITLIMCGRFLTDSTTATGGGVPLIYLGTPTADFVRASLARSSTTANILRISGRKADGDSSNGADVGGNQGSTPWIAIAEFDLITAQKKLRINGKATTPSSYFTPGATSNTDALYNGIGASSAGGTTTPFEWNVAGVKIGQYTVADLERIEGMIAWKLRMPDLLDALHTYRNSPP